MGVKGAELEASDGPGHVELRARLATPNDGRGSVYFELLFDEFGGLPLARVADAYRLMVSLHAPNRLRTQFRGSYSCWAKGETALGQLVNPDWEARTSLLEMLVELQPFSETPLVIPKELSVEALVELDAAVRLVRGEVLDGTWSQAVLDVHADAVDQVIAAITAEGSFETNAPLILTNDGQPVAIGTIRRVITDVLIGPTKAGQDGVVELVLRPGPAARAEESLISITKESSP